MKSSNQLDMLDTIEAITTSMFHHVRYSIVHRVLGSIILVQLYIIIKIARTCIVLSEHDANGKKLLYILEPQPICWTYVTCTMIEVHVYMY